MYWRFLPSLIAIVAVLGLAEIFSPEPTGKPSIPPSNEAHISKSSSRGMVGGEAPDYLTQRGVDLRTMISKVYERDPSRIILPASLDNHQEYDFVLVPPHELERSAVYQLMQQGIETHFAISTTTETRQMNVYVMTALEGKTPPEKSEQSPGALMITVSHGPEEVELRSVLPWVQVTPEMVQKAHEGLSSSLITSIAARNVSLHQFRTALERGLGRPIVDETDLAGNYDFVIRGKPMTTEAFLQMLQDQLGLVLTPESRSIEMLVFRSR
jgi:uncharacterized protein (TIGR03435 family)